MFAVQASDIVLMRSDMRAIPMSLRLSRATLRTIKSNLFWAFAYNTIAVPVAAAGLLNPMIAGAAYGVSVRCLWCSIRCASPDLSGRPVGALSFGFCAFSRKSLVLPCWRWHDKRIQTRATLQRNA